MADAVLGWVAGKGICDVLGLDADKVRSLTIRFAVDEVVSVVVEQYVSQEESGRLKNLIEDQYELHYKSSEAVDEFGKGVHDCTNFESKDWREYAKGVED